MLTTRTAWQGMSLEPVGLRFRVCEPPGTAAIAPWIISVLGALLYAVSGCVPARSGSLLLRACRHTLYAEVGKNRWVVVKIMVPFWVPSILGTVL